MSRPVKKTNETEDTLAIIRECLDYESETGLLTWRERPRSHFKFYRGWCRFQSMCAGKKAGFASGHGYFKIKISTPNGVLKLYTHRVVFALTRGRWPENEIDHINGNRGDNREANLRDATSAENLQNSIVRKNVSGFLGVSKEGNKGRPAWKAQIKVGGKNHHLGSFWSPEEAHTAYLKAKAELHTFNPIPRETA